MVPVDINAVARDAIQLAQLEGQSRIALHASFFEALPLVDGSREQLAQALCNLLVSARESLDGVDGAAIEIETEPDGDLVAVRILDNGPGMSEQRLEQIFDPFRSEEEELDDVPDGKQPNDAVGLLDACEILRDHSGTLMVRSRPGEGTCFIALLPIQRG
jgi:signal transduction histidine kinase